MSEARVALVVPTYNEADVILDHLRYHGDHFNFDSITVVDGGSPDGTYQRIRSSHLPVRAIQVSPAHRARQLSEGIRATEAPYLLFLHADTYLPESFFVTELGTSGASWGWFDCRLDEPGYLYGTIGRLISLRSALFSSPTGDQAIWARRSLLEAVGGIPDQPLMEDVELTRRLREQTPGFRVTKPVRTSARRWEENGPVRTVLWMWTLKVGYYLGLSSRTIARLYYGRTDTGQRSNTTAG